MAANLEIAIDANDQTLPKEASQNHEWIVANPLGKVRMPAMGLQ
jgi:hypothetical protein